MVTQYLSEAQFRQAVRKPTEDEINAAWIEAIAKYNLTTDAPGHPVISADYLPKGTTEQAQAYRDILNHEIKGARIFGSPGAGLEDSGFGEAQRKSGERGEEVFAKLLTWDGILDHCVSYWSVYRPDENGERDGDTDIDCILQFGSHILLIDVKNYRSGLEYHSLIDGKAMFCSYPLLHAVANPPYIHSPNMAFAQRDVQNYLAQHGSACTVESFVVLVPGRTGEAVLDPDITWPTGIPAMSYSKFIDEMKRRALADRSYLDFDPGMTREQLWLSTLVKHIYNGPISHIDAPIERAQWPLPTYDALAGIDTRDASAKGSDGRERKQWKGGRGAGQGPRRAEGSNGSDSSDSSDSSGSSSRAGQAHTPPARASRTGTTPFGSPQRRDEHHGRAHGNGGAYAGDRMINALPAMEPHDASFALMKDAHGTMLPLRFSGVSGMFVTGAGKNGMAVCMSTLVASVIASHYFDVTMLDCQENSTLAQYAPAVKAYVPIAEGLDVLASETDSIAVSMRARRMKLKGVGISDFWLAADHGGLRPQLLVVNGASRLYGDAANADEEQDARTIRRALQRIVQHGNASGMAVLLIAQQRSSDLGVAAELAELAQECQTTLCFHLPSPQRVQQVFGTGETVPQFGQQIALGQAICRQDGQPPQLVQCLNLASSKLAELKL
ncbi:hypothetical protein PG2083B_0519 [Bifidobacterium pseudolongum subsp. globosum]|uniref:nuclease-related domain-containing protein n=1 Tax=Bifidobacterium pseudolongum TaxID=1694 RepID=UPI00101ED7BE|nr:nuclease-related domain-containing protein [Bifidobacterium pseudolongum]RYQ18380.1 hypothetical protein PG2083B_0519 [Bifidobacterium pseudolongum subsp. globosum]